MARPSSLTPEMHAKLVDAFRIGCYQVEAAHFAGIREQTLIDWLKRGRADIARGDTGTDHARLVTDVEAAEAKAVVSSLTVIQRAAATGDWKAAIAFLERRHGKRWSGKVAVAVEAQTLADEVKELIDTIVTREDGPDADGGGDGG